MDTKNRYGVLALVCLAACNPSDPGGGVASAAFYAGPGSEWTAQLDPDGSGVLLHFPTLGATNADVLIHTTQAQAAAGFDALTVSSSAGTSPPAEGAQGFLLAPPGGPLVFGGFAGGFAPVLLPTRDCPDGPFDASLVKIKAASGWSPSLSDATGTLGYDPTSGAAVVTSAFTLDAPATRLSTPPTLGASPCVAGIAALNTGDELYLTSGRAALLHTTPSSEVTGGDEVYLVLPSAGALPASSLAGAYAGVLYVEASQVSSPVVCTLSASATGVGCSMLAFDVQGGTAGDTLAAVTLDSTSASGFAYGTVALGGAAQSLSCAIQAASPRVLACAGADASGGFVSAVLIAQ